MHAEIRIQLPRQADRESCREGNAGQNSHGGSNRRRERVLGDGACDDRPVGQPHRRQRRSRFEPRPDGTHNRLADQYDSRDQCDGGEQHQRGALQIDRSLDSFDVIAEVLHGDVGAPVHAGNVALKRGKVGGSVPQPDECIREEHADILQVGVGPAGPWEQQTTRGKRQHGLHRQAHDTDDSHLRHRAVRGRPIEIRWRTVRILGGLRQREVAPGEDRPHSNAQPGTYDRLSDDHLVVPRWIRKATRQHLGPFDRGEPVLANRDER